MQLIFMGILENFLQITPEIRCKHEGFPQAIPGEIRPQNYTKLTRNLPNLHQTCNFLYINLPNLHTLITNYDSPLNFFNSHLNFFHSHLNS